MSAATNPPRRWCPKQLTLLTDKKKVLGGGGAYVIRVGVGERLCFKIDALLCLAFVSGQELTQN